MEHARPATPEDADALLALAEQARAESVDKRGGRLLVNRELAALAELDLVETAEAGAAGASAGDGAGKGEGESDEGRTAGAPRKLVVVGTIDGVVVGYARFRVEQLRTDETIGMIDEIYVDPEARGVGVGEAMMDLLVATAQQHRCIGIDAVALPGDRQTKNFFETFGLVARAIVVHRPLSAPGA